MTHPWQSASVTYPQLLGANLSHEDVKKFDFLSGVGKIYHGRGNPAAMCRRNHVTFPLFRDRTDAGERLAQLSTLS